MSYAWLNARCKADCLDCLLYIFHVTLLSRVCLLISVLALGECVYLLSVCPAGLARSWHNCGDIAG